TVTLYGGATNQAIVQSPRYKESRQMLSNSISRKFRRHQERKNFIQVGCVCRLDLDTHQAIPTICGAQQEPILSLIASAEGCASTTLSPHSHPAVSGKLSTSTTNASHSFPSGSRTQVLSCVA